jgi:hypothetical protein
MASFIVYGDASGQVTVAAPSVAGSNTITFPAETGTLVTSATTTILPNQIAWDTAVKISGFTAVVDGGYFCNTSAGGFTVTLPLSPARGDFVVIVDYAGTSATNNITVSPNGGNINGISSNAILTTNRQGITFTYIDSTQGWLASSNVYGGVTPFVRPYTASYLVVAGGGGGGRQQGGGGGAGGYLTGTASLSPGIVYTATVGGGGAAGTGSPGNNGTSGSNSVVSGTGLTTVTSVGGGGGNGNGGPAAGNGGSGGGGGLGVATGGTGTSGQGNNGGASVTSGPNGGAGGGGGGASAVGSNSGSFNGSTTSGGNGGNGTASSITGSSVTYAGGGGGGGYANSGTPPSGTGGTGGGGAGGIGGVAGTANTGGGGGGGGQVAGNVYNGAAGGSGVVILSVPTANYTGTVTGSPTVTTSGSNTIIRFTGSGTYTA